MGKSTPNEFSKATIETLARRAGFTCSNPDCKAITAGPHSDESKAINLGEAAHIRGAELGSARYDDIMSPTERASVTNGIWLCGRCHTLVDRDTQRYTTDVLYLWKRQHESEIASKLSGGWERAVREKRLKQLEDESPIAYQIALDQPPLWEPMLTVELFRSKLAEPMREFRDLQRGLVYRPTKYLDVHQFFLWFGEKLTDLTNLSHLVKIILEEDLRSAWGTMEQAGDALEIRRAVDKMIDAYRGLLDWEIAVRFIDVPEVCKPIRQKMQGWTEEFLKEIERMPKEFSREFEGPRSDKQPTVTFSFNTPSAMFEVIEDMRELQNQGLL